MADHKIFAGPRIRRVRTQLGLTQANMAEQLGISPSYLNLIERNQRPLTVQLLLKLSTKYEIDLKELQGDESGQTNEALKEIFSDPLLAGEVASDSELIEAADSVPNLVSGLIHLYRAYKESNDKLSTLSHLMSDDAKAHIVTQSRLPLDEVRDHLQSHPYYFPELDEAATTLNAALAPNDDMFTSLKTYILNDRQINVKVLPIHTMADHSIRYDRHSQRIFLSERLTPEERLMALASQFALLAFGELIDETIKQAGFNNHETDRLLRLECAHYFALSLLMPYETFYTAAARSRYDIGLLSRRFQVRWRDVVRRITSLHKPGRTGVPFFMIELDPVGNVCTFNPGANFSLARAGNPCLKLIPPGVNTNHGRVAVESVALSDGPEWLVIAHAEKTRAFGHGDRPRRRTLIIGCDLIHARDIAYGDGFSGVTPKQIGVTCRLCEVANCRDRAFPPVMRPGTQDLNMRSFSDYDFS
ncbi:MAG: short-chain fatty acyl-CoA regulator family protein [Hyphomicrobiales bacterium]